MIFNDGERMHKQIPKGVQTTVNMNLPYKFIIETHGGTIIEGRAVPNAPLTVTIYDDIKRFDITLDKDCVTQLHLVDPAT